MEEELIGFDLFVSYIIAGSFTKNVNIELEVDNFNFKQLKESLLYVI